MAKFLQSRTGIVSDDDILNQNILTMAHLRGLIPGDFHLEYLGEAFLLLHEKGIFVLKQCHQNGMIHGELQLPQWTDLNYLGEGTPFSNPLLENERNIQRLTEILKLPKENIHSCILFDTQCELRHVPKDNRDFTIMRVDQLEAFFAEFPQRPLRYTHTQLAALNDIFLLVSAQG